jgi:hypothetical protein
MKWLRLWTEWAQDPKITTMPESMQRRHIVLLCLRRTVDTSTLDDDEIASYMRISMEDLQETKELFQRKKFIDNGWNVLKWDFRNPPSDSSVDRTRKYRERQRKKESDKDETSQERHGDAVEKSRVDKKRVEKELLPLTGKSRQPDCRHQEIIQIYHDELPTLPRIIEWDDTARKWLKARWRSAPERQDLDFWKEFFQYVRESPFLMGDSERGWMADLRWLVRSQNFAKVINGSYHFDKQSRNKIAMEVWREHHRRKEEGV